MNSKLTSKSHVNRCSDCNKEMRVIRKTAKEHRCAACWMELRTIQKKLDTMRTIKVNPQELTALDRKDRIYILREYPYLGKKKYFVQENGTTKPFHKDFHNFTELLLNPTTQIFPEKNTDTTVHIDGIGTCLRKALQEVKIDQHLHPYAPYSAYNDLEAWWDSHASAHRKVRDVWVMKLGIIRRINEEPIKPRDWKNRVTAINNWNPAIEVI